MSPRRLLIGVGIFLVLLMTPALAERRVALVIGNADYQSVSPLDNPKRDAEAIATSLTNLGFDVVTGIDLDQRGMQKALRRFSQALVGSDVALFYYAGHGIQVDGQNYLIPVDAELQDETDLPFATVEMNLILDQMEREPRVKLVFLDACRDNPFKEQLASRVSRTRSTGQVADGLAQMSVTSSGGTLIAYATDPGALAIDGNPNERHSPFTQALLNHIERPGLEIHSMMIDVRSEVWDTTSEQQRPWSNSSLTGKFYFSAPEPATIAPVAYVPRDAEPRAALPEIERELWRAAAIGDTVEDYQVYLNSFPNGRFSPLAEARLEHLSRDAQASPQSPPDAPLAPVEREALIGMTPRNMRELQRRLTLAGFNTGGADGVLGPQSRAAISAWQQSINATPTGFVTGPQMRRLSEDTNRAYRAYVAAQSKRRDERRRLAAKQAEPPEEVPQQRVVTAEPAAPASFFQPVER